MSNVMCHMSWVTCCMLHVMCHFFFFFLQSGEAQWGRVFYQQGLPCLGEDLVSMSQRETNPYEYFQDFLVSFQMDT